MTETGRIRGLSWILLAWWAAVFLLGGGRAPGMLGAAACLLFGVAALSGGIRTPRGFDLWGFWGLWLAVTAFGSSDPWVSLRACGPQWLALLFLAMAVQSWGEHAKRLVLPLFWIGAFAAGCAALWGRHVGASPAGWFGPNPNLTAVLVAAGFASAWCVLWARDDQEGADVRWTQRRWIAPVDGGTLRGLMVFLCVAFAAIGLGLHSRGAVFAGLGGAFAGSLWIRSRSGVLVLWILLGGAAILGSWTGKIDAFLKMSDPFSMSRPRIWQVALEAAGEFPILGVGPGRFEQAFLANNFPVGDGISRFSRYADHAHSEILHIAAETGWVGLLLWLGALGATFRGGFIDARRRPWAIPALAGAGAMLLFSLIDGVFRLPWAHLSFFAFFASAWPDPKEQGQWRWNAPFPRIWVLAAWASTVLVFANRPDPETEALGRAVRFATAKPTQPAKALMELRRAKAMRPTNALTWMREADLARALGDAEAVELLTTKAIALEPNFIGARFLRAEALLRKGNPRAARLEFDAAEGIAKRLSGIPIRSGFDRALVSIDPARKQWLKERLFAPAP